MPKSIAERFVEHKAQSTRSPDYVKARKQVADDWRQLSQDIRIKDNYASHVTEEEKDKNLQDGLKYADEIEKGLHDNNFTIAQRINYVLTSKSVPLLPPVKPVSKLTQETLDEVANQVGRAMSSGDWALKDSILESYPINEQKIIQNYVYKNSRDLPLI